MAEKTLQTVLNRLYAADVPDKADIEYALSLQDPAQMAELFAFADEIRKRHVGDGILLRGIVEFSNYCDNTCKYCGLNKTNTNLAPIQTDRQADSQLHRASRQCRHRNSRSAVRRAGRPRRQLACRNYSRNKNKVRYSHNAFRRRKNIR